MVHFVGAGPGAADLITLRGARLLEEADVIIYAGSLVNPALLDRAKEGCALHNSATMTLEEVLAVIEQAEAAGRTTVRLHTGDPSLYGAIREQMDALDARHIPYDDTPGVSSFCGAAAALCAEYTLPDISQSVIITRMPGRTAVPEREALADLARHGASMVLFLSAGMMERVQQELSGWFGDQFDEVEVAATYNLILNAANMIRNGVGIALGFLIGNLTDELKFVPLSPPMETGSVLVWKKDQTFSPAAAEFLRSLRNTE